MNLASFVHELYRPFESQMSIQPDYPGVRRAVSILLLAAGAIAHEGFANPVLLEESERPASESSRDEISPGASLRPEGRLTGADPTALPLPVVIDEIRIDERAPGRRPGWVGTLSNPMAVSSGMPGGYGGIFGQGETLREQFLRDFRSATEFSGGEQPAGSDPLRRDAGQNLANPNQVLLREAIDYSLRLVRDSIVDEIDLMSISVTGTDFLFAFGGGPRPSTASTEYWSTMPQVQLFDDVRADTAARTTFSLNAQGMGSFGGAVIASEAQPVVAPDHPAPLLVQKIREFITDATTIAVVLACLIVWLAYEMTSAIRERRRVRRIRRRRDRARG